MSHTLGRSDLQLAILAEGNTSARLGANRMLVKASGSALATMTTADLVECHTTPLLNLLDRPHPRDEEIHRTLLACRVRATAKKPSVEVLFHAWLLTLPGVEFVGHAHPVAANQLLCSPRARDMADKRIYPDEVVCCGQASVFVPYHDPGHELAREVRRHTNAYMKRFRETPRVILLQNHGVITLGRTPEAVIAAMLMAEKAARLRVGAVRLGGPRFMSARDIRRIASRSDEHERRRALNV
jgi:rhamnose utilization protein RhaD (predicted bifunctional aldolase and dehydrogenase)